jgi:hypothetical protein
MGGNLLNIRHRNNNVDHNNIFVIDGIRPISNKVFQNSPNKKRTPHLAKYSPESIPELAGGYFLPR